MLGFIIPLKAPRTSRCWERVCHHYRRTLRSVENQRGASFRAYTVSHEIPAGVHDTPWHRTLQSTHPPPPYPGTMDDKWRKVAQALEPARRDGVTHFMVLDGDDWVSDRLAQHVAQTPPGEGWWVETGYFARSAEGPLRLWQQFHRFCGSSTVLPLEPIYRRVRTLADPAVALQRLCHHNGVGPRLASLGIQLQPLPFPAAVYVRTFLENHSYTQRHFWLWGWRRWWLARGRGVPRSSEWEAEFGLRSPG